MPLIIHLPNDIWAFFIFLGVLFGVVGLADFLARKIGLKPENSRKIAHVLVGLFVSFAPFVFQRPYAVVALGLLFIVINWLALKRESFKGMHGTQRVSYGTVLFPLAFVILVYLYWYPNPAILITAMLVLAIADPGAALVGERTAKAHTYLLYREKKSLEGSLAFFIITFLIILATYPPLARLARLHPPIPLSALLPMAAITALAATGAEALSYRGSDNLSLTLATAFMLDLSLWIYSTGQLAALVGWAIFLTLLVFTAYRLQTLDGSGTVGAFLLGLFLAALGNWSTMLPLLTFFILSSLMSKIAEFVKGRDENAEKGSRRDLLQVLANGGPALLFMLLGYYSHKPLFYGAFLVSLASAAADTWETEGGRFAPRAPRNILTWRKVTRGTSGGVSLTGSLSGLVGAATVILAGISFYQLQPGSIGRVFGLLVLTGFVGSLIDSLLGAGVQAQYVCTVCGKTTEKRIHCQHSTRHMRGWNWLNNDVVNFISNAAAGVLWILLSSQTTLF